MTIIIEKMDEVYSRISKRDAQFIAKGVEWTSFYWKKNNFGFKEKVVYKDNIFMHKTPTHCEFYSGFLPRIRSYCDSHHLTLSIASSHNAPLPHVPPNLPKIEGFLEFRNDQLQLIQLMRRHRRGVIKSATGTGKTIMQLGIMSCFPDINILLLAHTNEIVYQTYEKLLNFGFEGVVRMGDSSGHSGPEGRITVCTRQTFIKFDPKSYRDYYQMVIIDEGHHISAMRKTDKSKGEYIRVLENLNAQIRLGFTATMPKEMDRLMAIEGLLGPIIGEVTLNDAVNEGILAQPKIRILKSSLSDTVRKERKYDGVYKKGIVDNHSRNVQIMGEAKRWIDEEKSVLILVTALDHGQNLLTIAQQLGINAVFLRGETKQCERQEMKEAFIARDLPCIIASVIWVEGVDIPNLNVVINAAGGKGELRTLQKIGRGLRKTNDKEECVIVDFFDPSHNYLIAQFGERITLYMDNNWKFI